MRLLVVRLALAVVVTIAQPSIAFAQSQPITKPPVAPPPPATGPFADIAAQTAALRAKLSPCPPLSLHGEVARVRAKLRAMAQDAGRSGAPLDPDFAERVRTADAELVKLDYEITQLRMKCGQAVPGASHASEGAANATVPPSPTASASSGPKTFPVNPFLRPETSDSWTLGVVITPTFLPGFTATIDYYNVFEDDCVPKILDILDQPWPQGPGDLGFAGIQSPWAKDPVGAAITDSYMRESLGFDPCPGPSQPLVPGASPSSVSPEASQQPDAQSHSTTSAPPDRTEIDSEPRPGQTTSTSTAPNTAPPKATPPPKPGPLQQVPTPVTSVFDQGILKIHNTERLDVGVPPLQWDPQLARDATAYAQELARTGQLVHAPRAGRGDERENLNEAFHGSGPEQLMQNWVAEKHYFHPGIFPDVCDGDWSRCAHYSQMIWPTTTDVGCGVARGVQWDFFVCRYSPGGNKDGKLVGRVPAVAPERGR